jgi:hypothetical protein
MITLVDLKPDPALGKMNSDQVKIDGITPEKIEVAKYHLYHADEIRCCRLNGAITKRKGVLGAWNEKFEAE